MNIPWTEGEREILKTMIAARKRAADIGRVLKSRSTAAIFNQAYSMGLKITGETPEIDADEFKRIMKGR